MPLFSRFIPLLFFFWIAPLHSKASTATTVCVNLQLRQAAAQIVPVTSLNVPRGVPTLAAHQIVQILLSRIPFSPQFADLARQALQTYSTVELEADPYSGFQDTRYVALWAHQVTDRGQTLYVMLQGTDYALHIPHVRNAPGVPLIRTFRPRIAALLDSREGDSLRAYATSPRAPLIALSESGPGEAQATPLELWNWKSGTRRALHTPRAILSGSLQFSSDGRHLAALSERSLLVWRDLTSNRPEERILRDGVTAYDQLEFSPTGRWLAASMRGGGIHVYDLNTPISDAQPIVVAGTGTRARMMRFSDDTEHPRLLVAWGDGTARSVSLTGPRNLVLFDHGRDIAGTPIRDIPFAAFSADQTVTTVANLHGNPHLMLWNARTGTHLDSSYSGWAVPLIQLLPNQARAAFTARSDGAHVLPQSPAPGYASRIVSASYASENQLLAGLVDLPGRTRDLAFWSADTGTLVPIDGRAQSLLDSTPMTDVALVEGGRALAVSGPNTLRVFDLSPVIRAR